MNSGTDNPVVQMKTRLRNRCKGLSALQRRTILGISVNMLLLGTLTIALEHVHLSKAAFALFAMFPAFPMLAILFILGRYLARETDEFIRWTVVKALLWGAAATVAGDTLQSGLVAFSAAFWGLDPGTLTSLNFDLLFMGAGISLALQLRRNR